MAKTDAQNSMTNTTPTHDEIAAHAYQIYLREGCQEGRDLDNWLRAETELRARATNGSSSSSSNGHTQNAPEPTAVSPARVTRTESILPNSVVSPASPIAQVSRSTAPKKSNKREAAAAK